MAHLFRQPKSAFWWISFRHPLTGQRQRESTGFRHSILAETRRARLRCSEHTTAEQTVLSLTTTEAWAHWVPTFLKTTYAAKPGTRFRYLAIWQNFAVFLATFEIPLPRQFTRAHAFQYFDWRQAPHPGTFKARHNTALLELKIIGMLCREAVERDYLRKTPCTDMGISRVPPKEKPELTADQLTLISKAIDREKGPYKILLRRSFDIARYHGTRLNFTWLNPQTDVFEEPAGDGPAWLIRFRGKKNREDIVPLAPELIPLFKKLRQQGATETYERPIDAATGLPRTSRVWSDFLRRSGLRQKIPGVTHHCLRVTVISTLARQDVSEAKAQAFVGHSSTTVHRQYQRLKPRDLAACTAAATRLNTNQKGQ